MLKNQKINMEQLQKIKEYIIIKEIEKYVRYEGIDSFLEFASENNIDQYMKALKNYIWVDDEYKKEIEQEIIEEWKQNKLHLPEQVLAYLVNIEILKLTWANIECIFTVCNS